MNHGELPANGPDDYVGWLCEHPECKFGQAVIALYCHDCIRCWAAAVTST